MTKTALILGSSGRAARHVSEALNQSGWELRGFERGMDDLDEKAEGADVIVYGWNPPYPKWETQAEDGLAMAIDAALRHDATLFFPANVYVYGQSEALPWDENTPHQAVNALGEVRVRMEAMLKGSGVKTIVLRAGDFIDTTASGNWFDAVMTRNLAKGKFVYPGAWDRKHAWAFLPDYGRAAAALIEKRESLPRFTEVEFAGYSLTGEALARSLEGYCGRRLDRNEMNWGFIKLAAAFWPMGRALLSMRYLWNTPHTLCDVLMKSYLPDFEETPIERAWLEVFKEADTEPSRARERS